MQFKSICAGAFWPKLYTRKSFLFRIARSAFGFPAPLTLRAILGTLRGQNWGKTSFKNNCVGANSKNRMPVWCSRLNDAREHLCTSYMQAFFATPGQVRGTQSKKENLWALSVFRLNLMLNHHVGRQPPEICVFSSHFLENLWKMLVKYQYLEYFRKNLS